VEDTWTSRDLPVLEVVVEGFTDPERFMMTFQEVVGACGLPEREVKAGLRDLWASSFVEAPRPPEELTYPLIVTGVTERARRAVGQWPTPDSLAARLVKGLREAAEQEDDPVRRKGLKEAAGFLGETARGVVAEVCAKVILHAGGMG
jgi:hypothetical protein